VVSNTLSGGANECSAELDCRRWSKTDWLVQDACGGFRAAQKSSGSRLSSGSAWARANLA
jgi:hypothetical protein